MTIRSLPLGEESLSPVDACRARLRRRICALEEHTAHAKVVAEELYRVGSEVGVAMLHDFHRQLRGEDDRTTYMGVFRMLVGQKELPYHLRETMYRVAREHGFTSVALSLLRLPPKRVPHSGECMEPAPPEGDLTLGERKWRARTLNRDLLLRIARDPSPSVVRNLLQNPRIVERDIVRLTATRPCKAEVLEMIANHRKWPTLPQVQVALASNPYTPPHIAVAVLPLIAVQELKKIRNDGNLHAVVLEVSSYLVDMRKEQSQEAIE